MTSPMPLILERSSDFPVVEIRHVILTGAAVEPREVVGVGRIALRMLRRGAAGMGCKELDEAIDRIASVISTQATPDFYALHLRVLRRFLDRATEIFAKIVNDPTLDLEELERLKRETRAEIISSRDDDRHLASRALRMLVFGDHPYSASSRGTIETIEEITLDHVRDFLAEHLVAPNMLIGAAGDITEEELGERVERTLGSLAEGGRYPIEDLEAATPRPGVHVLLVDKPERVQTQIFVGHLGPPVDDPLDMPLRVAMTAFGGTFTSRLMQEVRVKRGWSYGAYASPGRGRLPEILSLYAFPAIGDAVPCLKLLLDLFSELRREGPTSEDISFARDYLARGMALQRDTTSARLSLRLRQEIFGLPKDYYDTYAERVRTVTPQMATEAVQKHLDDQNLCIAISCTASDLKDTLRSMLGDEAVIETIPFDSPMF